MLIRSKEMEIGSSPKNITSKRSIKYRKSLWKLNEFEVWSGDFICRAVALHMNDSLLVWLGGREPHLSEVSLALPGGSSALTTTLLDSGLGTSGLAQRLAVALGRQVYICSGQEFDRFTAPLVERGVVAQIKKYPGSL